MTSKDFIEKATMEELKQALKLRQINEELYECLISSLSYILYYCHKHDISLPERDKISLLLDRFNAINEKLPKSVDYSFLNSTSNNKQDYGGM